MMNGMRLPRRPRIGLALSGGGAKAAAHVGVLRVLQVMGLSIDLVAGTSGGALAGVFYCDGHSPSRCFEILQSDLMGRPWWRRLPGGRYWQLARLFRNGVLRDVIRRHVSAQSFEQLKIPLFTTATDLVTGEGVVHAAGEVAPAVLASMSLPGFAPPVEIDGRFLVDGGVLNNLPIQVLLRQGADIVIAVDLSGCNAPKPEWSMWRPGRHSLDVLRRSWEIQNRELSRRQLAAADVVIRPEVADFGIADLARMDELMRRGEEAAMRSISLIEGVLKSWEPLDAESRRASLGDTTLLRRHRGRVRRRGRTAAAI